MVDIVPAILSYTREDLLRKAGAVGEVAPALHIDIMDGVFVKNKTIGIADALAIRTAKPVEYHLMVSDPENYIEALPGGQNSIFEVHVESLHGNFDSILGLVKRKNSKLALVLNPATPPEEALSRLPALQMVLVMAVVPGIDGQKYMPEVENKMSLFRHRSPGITIEVDGGVNMQTAQRAVAAGANRLAAASAIFGAQNPQEAYRNLHRLANSQMQ